VTEYIVKMKRLDFDMNLTKMKWCPKHLTEIPAIISNAFGREITMKQIEPIIGTDHLKEWVLNKDADIKEFYDAPTVMQEWLAEKVIKVKIPRGIIPRDFEPKKVKILATGDRIAKFFGEDTVSTRQVEGSLKLFDCGHFYMKQTLPGSGPSPHWTVFEGRWHQRDRGIRLEYLLRYSWQTSRKPDMEFSIEAVKPNLASTLAWDGETERQLNGNLPATVGTDDYFWAELVRMGDKGQQGKIRWNTELFPDNEEAPAEGALPEERAEETPEETEEREKGETEAKPKLRSRFEKGAKSEDPTPDDGPTAKGKKTADSREGSSAQQPKTSASSTPGVPTTAAVNEEDENMLATYIGFGIFLFFVFIFMYSNYA